MTDAGQRPPVGWRCLLADSELGTVQVLADRLLLPLAVAWLTDGTRSGLAPGVSLLLWGVVGPAGPPAVPDGALGRLREARLLHQGRWQPGWWLNHTLAGPLRLELGFGQGVCWDILAHGGGRCEGPERPRLRESMAC